MLAKLPSLSLVLVVSTLLSACGSTPARTPPPGQRPVESTPIVRTTKVNTSQPSETAVEVAPTAGMTHQLREPGSTADLACVCGTAEADVFGCACAQCETGEGNSANPHCTCGALTSRKDLASRANKAGTKFVYYGSPDDPLPRAADGEGPSDKLQRLVTTKGEVIYGRIEEDDGQSLFLRVLMDGGTEATTRVSYKRLSPRTVYRLMLARTGDDDAAGHLAIGKYADEQGLYEAARAHYQRAAGLDAELELEAEKALLGLTERAATAALEGARHDVATGNDRRASKRLAKLLEEFPETAAADEAQELLGDIASLLAAERAVKHGQAIAKSMEPLENQLATAEKAALAGLQTSRRPSKAIHQFKSAVANLNAARGKAAGLGASATSDQLLSRALAGFNKRSGEALADANLHLGSVYLTLADFKHALGAANAALAVSPGNRDALALRSRIETAAAAHGTEDDGYGWRRRARIRGWRGIGVVPQNRPGGALRR